MGTFKKAYVKAERDTKITLVMDEATACDVYLHLHPAYIPNECDIVKKQIRKALGYEPLEAPNL